MIGLGSDKNKLDFLINSVLFSKLYHLDNRMAMCQLWVTVLALNKRKERLLTCSQQIKSPPVVGQITKSCYATRTNALHI